MNEDITPYGNEEAQKMYSPPISGDGRRYVDSMESYIYDKFGPCQHGDPYQRDV